MDTVDLDPELAPIFGSFPEVTLDAEVLAGLRAAGAAVPLPETGDAVECTDHVVREDPELIVRVHRPRGVDGLLPCVYSMHGGLYVLGSRAMDDARLQSWASARSCVCISVEYRLAPESSFPVPLDDCYDGLRWTFEHADEVGVDPQRVGVAGASAGGGLAAALALRARDESELRLAFQLLESAMLDDRQITSSSRRDGLPVLSRGSSEFGWRSYLGELSGSDDVPEYAAVARATDLSGLPPALVIVGAADGFRDENVDYAARLMRAGVPTDLHVFAGAPHGVQMATDSSTGRQWNELVDAWLTRQLHPGSGPAA